MTNREIIAVIQAAEEGKQIEERNKKGQERWHLCEKGHSWDFLCLDYRVKAEPREFWLVETQPGSIIEFRGYNSKQDGVYNIHVREVLDDN